MIARSLVAQEALKWKGTPFHHQASLKGVGVDCIGLVCGVADALGLPEAKRWREDIRYRGYGRLPVPSKLLAACSEYMDQIVNPGLGDVLLFTFMKEPMHFGIITQTSPRYLVHAYETIGHVTEHRIDEKWERRIVGSYRLRGVE